MHIRMACSVMVHRAIIFAYYDVNSTESRGEGLLESFRLIMYLVLSRTKYAQRLKELLDIKAAILLV